MDRSMIGKLRLRPRTPEALEVFGSKGFGLEEKFTAIEELNV